MGPNRPQIGGTPRPPESHSSCTNPEEDVAEAVHAQEVHAVAQKTGNDGNWLYLSSHHGNRDGVQDCYFVVQKTGGDLTKENDVNGIILLTRM